MEKHNIKIYNYKGKEARIIEKEGCLWWVASDLSKITGHRAIRTSTNKILNANEIDIIYITDITGRANHFQIINESGFYKLMFRSKLPQAKAFTKFVTSVMWQLQIIDTKK